MHEWQAIGCRCIRLTNINFAYSDKLSSFSKRSVGLSKFPFPLHWLQMEVLSVCVCRGVGWWIAENVLDASLCFVCVTLAVNLPVTAGSSDRVQKLGDVSCILEQFPAETNAAGQTSICGCVAETDTEQRDRCRERNSTGFGKEDSQTTLLFYPLVLVFNLGYLEINSSLTCRSSWRCWTSWLTFCLW